jgi:signal transduction histidine kinase
MVHVGATSERARGDLHNIDAAYREDTRRLIANRFPISGCIFLGLMAIAYAIEWTYYPERFWSLLLCYGAFAAVLVASVLALRWQPRHALAIVVVGSIAIAFLLAAYLALVQGSAELCLLGMIGLLTGEVVQFPWGARGQVSATIAAFAAYLWSLHAGAAPALPVAYGIFALAAHAPDDDIGAQLLESYRLTAYREAAESARANAAKGEFLATVSHELRTPLSIIVGYTDLLLDGAFEQRSEEVDALTRIRYSSRQLLDLIQSMLDLNRIESGGISLAVEEFQVASAIDSLRAGLPANWCKPGVALAWDTDAVQARMRTDRGKLEMILRNLIHNALKYTEHGAVTVSARSKADAVNFVVADTGQGIHADDLDRIFEMFGQGSNGGPPRGGGVGLGLYIVKQLATALGGTVRVDSNPGAGSRFTVSLPLQVPPQQ